MTKLEDNIFECAECGSPAIKLPKIITDTAEVHCGRCGASLGNWGQFRALINERVTRSHKDLGSLVSADPLK